MFIGREKELDIVRRMLDSPSPLSGGIGVVSFHGLFGAGKTTLLRRIREVVERDGLVDAILTTNEDVAPSSLPEFVYALASGFQSLDPEVFRLILDETDARRRRYLQIAGQLGVDALPLLQRLRSEAVIDPRDHAVDSEAFALEVAVKSQFNNRDDQRLTLDTGNVVAEALIVDLMTTFFPMRKEGGMTEHLATSRPRRILVLIDTFEKISGLVGPWLLESLLPYVYNRRFGDFQSYRSPYLPDRVHVRDFFDVRFIIAGRERLSLTDHERRWDRYRDQMVESKVGPFSPDELRSFLSACGVDGSDSIDEVFGLTEGLPYLASLWVDSVRAESGGPAPTFLSTLAEDRILWYKDVEQREWIRAAAFLDWFDADALRCFEPIGESAQRAFEYLRNSSELTRPSHDMPGKYEVHEIIRRALRDATDQESGDRAMDYREAAAAFYAASEVLSRFPSQERRILRRLAYFARFDDHAIAEFFGGEAHLARGLVSDNPDLFDGSDGGWALRANVAHRLGRYNRRADGRQYTETLAAIHDLWTRRSDELDAAIRDQRREVGTIEAALRENHARVEGSEELRERTAGSIRELEIDLQGARRRWYSRMSPRETLVARLSFFLFVVSLLIVFFAELLPVDESTAALIRTSALAISALFLLVLSLSVGRMLYVRSRRQEHAALRDDVASIESRLGAARRAMRELDVEIEGARRTADALGSERDRLLARIVELEAARTRPYV